MSCASFVLTVLGVVLVFMPFSDRSHSARRLMWGVGAVMQVGAFALAVIFPFTTPVALALILLFGFGGALAGEPFYKTWSQELFPTMLRTTAQGLTYASTGTKKLQMPRKKRATPTLSIRPVALILMIFLTISGVVGFFFMPNTAGKSLEEIEAERSGRPASERVPA